MISFSSFPMREELMQAITDLGFETPTPIQQKVIPALLTGPKDIIGLAQTGTGKTAAFGLPLLHHMDVSERRVQCLVLSPTRELCMQIQTELNKYAAHMRGLHIVSVYGGVPINGQIRELRTPTQVVVATPGRLIDLLERKAINLDEVEYVVLDEADEMLRDRFGDQVGEIIKLNGGLPSECQVAFFSATMPPEVRELATDILKDPVKITLKVAEVSLDGIKQFAVPLDDDSQKLDCICDICIFKIRFV
jgi:ATP-dependent RNA helicase DeaD